MVSYIISLDIHLHRPESTVIWVCVALIGIRIRAEIIVFVSGLLVAIGLTLYRVGVGVEDVFRWVTVGIAIIYMRTTA